MVVSLLSGSCTQGTTFFFKNSMCKLSHKVIHCLLIFILPAFCGLAFPVVDKCIVNCGLVHQSATKRFLHISSTDRSTLSFGF